MSSFNPSDFLTSHLWGEAKTFPLDAMWLVLTSIYHGSPIWRQVPMRVDEDAPVPSEFRMEISQLTLEVMQGLKAKLEREGEVWDIESLILRNSLTNLDGAIGGILEQSVSDGDRFRLSSVLVEELADRFAPEVCRKVMEGLKQSLSIEFEQVPFSFLPPGKRDETMITRQESVPNPSVRPLSGPAPMLTRTILGRAIWRPSLVPFVVPRAWIPEVLGRRDHLAFQGVLPKRGKGKYSCLLEPLPWKRWDLVHPQVEPIAVLPLSLVDWPPRAKQLREAARGYTKGSLASINLGILAANLKELGWYTLCDLLDPPLPKTGDDSTTAG